LKITILSPAHPFRGGIAASSERLAMEFIDLGHEVLIYTFTRQYPSLLFPGKTQFSESPPPPGLKIKRMIHAYNPFNWIAAGLALRKLETDIIIVRYWIPFMAPALGTIVALGKKKRKTFGLVDNIIPHEKHFYDKILSSYFTRFMDAFVVMSKSVKEELKDFISYQSVEYQPHPIYDIYGPKISRELALEKLGLAPDCRYILFFGFIRDYKGLDLLLKAFAEPVFADQDMKLIIAGEFYGNRDKYEALIDSLGIRDRLIIKSDFISDPEVKNYFCAADLLVQPYKTATQSGIAQIAYHFELPMVVSNVGGLPEIVINDKSGYVVERDPKQIAEAIQKYFNEKKSETFRSGTRELKNRFSWTKLAGAFLD
jgi:D-inositol-3-phosphate glycosyltransferase